MSNPEFVENIRKWVVLDSQTRVVNDKLREIREKKQELVGRIQHYVKQNSLEHKHIDISDGELRFAEKKEYKPLTFRYVEECLGNLLHDKTHVATIMEYLRTHRQVDVEFEIRRQKKAV